MTNKIFSVLAFSLFFPFASMAMSSYTMPTDTTKAVKIAKKAQKLIASGKPEKAEKAKVLYEQAADMGLRSAQRWMADYHWSQTPPKWMADYHWSQTPPNVKAAMVWEDALAQQGDTHSQYLLGCIYLGYDKRNLGIAPDEAKGYAYMKMAADWGIRDAQYIIGDCLLKGIGVEQNYDQAFIWMKRAADKNNMHAQFCVGSYYFFGDGQCDVDYKKALEYYTLSALQGLAEAQYNLGHMYQYAEGVEKNLDDAIYWYTKAAEQGHRFAKNNLALAIEEKNGSNENALYLIRKSAEEGDGVAQYNLGARYSDGNGVTQDAEMAVYWYTKSANQGCAAGQRQLGLAYLYGEGIAKDESKGFEWISKSAEQKNSGAINLLGCCYEKGVGVTADPQKAFQCYKEAADLGSVVAQYNLALCYGNGDGVTMNMEKCKSLLRKCANQNENEEIKRLAKEALNAIK